jgi:hypothetical protein
MPLFLLVLMFLPRVKGVFAPRKNEGIPSEGVARDDLSPAVSARWSVASVGAVLFLIVVYSNFVVDSADWIERSIAEWNTIEES